MDDLPEVVTAKRSLNLDQGFFRLKIMVFNFWECLKEIRYELFMDDMEELKEIYLSQYKLVYI